MLREQTARPVLCPAQLKRCAYLVQCLCIMTVAGRQHIQASIVPKRGLQGKAQVEHRMVSRLFLSQMLVTQANNKRLFSHVDDRCTKLVGICRSRLPRGHCIVCQAQQSVIH